MQLNYFRERKQISGGHVYKSYVGNKSNNMFVKYKD